MPNWQSAPFGMLFVEILVENKKRITIKYIYYEH